MPNAADREIMLQDSVHGQEKEDLFISTFKEQREPADKAFLEFLADRGCPEADNPDGIPEVSLMYYDGEEVVRLQDISLTDIDGEIRKRKLWQRDVLYRVDYLKGGKPKMAMGTTDAGNGAGTFLEWIDGRSTSGGKAETQILCCVLKQHLALCGMERIARDEISLKWQAGEQPPADSAGEESLYLRANASYYSRLLSYIREARRAMNMQQIPVLPPFPERGPFMAEWYRNYRDSRGGKADED